MAVFLAIFCWVPTLYDRASTRLREQFRFLASPAPWLIFAATMFGNAGVFALVQLYQALYAQRLRLC